MRALPGARELPETADGKQLAEIDHYEDGGGRVPDRIVERGGLIAAIRLLEEIALRDQEPRYRREARVQADNLKRLVRRRAGQQGETISDAEMLGNLLEVVRERRKHALPPAGQATLVIENGSD